MYNICVYLSNYSDSLELFVFMYGFSSSQHKERTIFFPQLLSLSARARAQTCKSLSSLSWSRLCLSFRGTGELRKDEKLVSRFGRFTEPKKFALRSTMPTKPRKPLGANSLGVMSQRVTMTRRERAWKETTYDKKGMNAYCGTQSYSSSLPCGAVPAFTYNN